MQRYWFGDVDHGVCHPAGSDMAALDDRLDHLASNIESYIPLQWEDATACGIVRNREEYLRILRQLCMQRAERMVRASLEERDQEIIQMVRLLSELDTTINSLLERVTSWYSLTNPDVMKGRGFRQEKVLIDRLKEHPDPGFRACLEGIETLRVMRSTLSRQISVRAEALFPNCSALVGGLVAARLITRAGGLQKLARMPSATIQVLGAEAALFSHLRTGTPPPKHGIIFQHKRVHSAPKRVRGRVARVLASQLAIAARLDAGRGEPELVFLDEAQKKINKAGEDRVSD